jgi:long-subunit acyl-CoA synthetase (AMP-forming)
MCVLTFFQFPDDIIGKTANESIPPYDLQGKSSKDVPSTICFSSGTTGKMKGVQLSHYNLVMNSIIMRASMPVRVNSNVREVFFAPCKLSTSYRSNSRIDAISS